MSKVPGVIPSAAAGVPLTPAKRTRLEYSTVAKTDNSTPKALKKACYAIDCVALKIDDEYVSYQHDSRAKATYFMLYNKEGAEKCMNMPIYYNGITMELYQTVTLEEGTQIITIPSTNSINIRYVVEAVNNTFIKNGIIYDFSAYKNKNNDKFHTFGVKFLFKKTIYSFEIPTFLEIDKFVLALTYRRLGSGLLIAVKNRSGWDISELRSIYSCMSVKITSKLASGTKEEIIVVNIHTPHLSSHKNRIKKEVQEYLQNLIKKKSDKKIILAGDFNMDPKKTINWINKMGIRLTRMSVNNALGLRMKGTVIGKMINHICASNIDYQVIRASVTKCIGLSDYFPVTATWITAKNTVETDQKKNVDKKMLELKSDSIINHNYYAVLLDQADTAMDTNSLVNNIIEKLNCILNDLKINKPVVNGKIA
ncbi:hypothetical protein BB561_003214 [Smittium simulii]|uniref:Endonuclease/exonuclease/phosphatase domain-containing protein n=1 Tax=Smittium simulii TaxID=133385 RepID=A0A2T9YMI3_9FUNG|nr:hypothetical protein BB561_003214 [Smittium simulii]